MPCSQKPNTVTWDIQVFETLDSTQSHLKTLAEQGAPDGTVVQALTQTAGHGRHGRKWVSQRGNLYFSFLLRPNRSVQETGQLSILIGAALGKALSSYAEDLSILRLKWPNDVMLGGKKCAGILIETGTAPDGTLNWVAVGIGVNIRTSPVIPDRETTCLADFISEDMLPAIKTVRDLILSEVLQLSRLWNTEGFDPIRHIWMNMSYSVGTSVNVKLEHTLKTGLFENIDKTGALILKQSDDHLITVTAGEIFV